MTLIEALAFYYVAGSAVFSILTYWRSTKFLNRTAVLDSVSRDRDELATRCIRLEAKCAELRALLAEKKL